MKHSKQPEMPGCKPLPMKFKEVPTVNATGTVLGLCEKCQGSGEVCTATKNSINKLGASVKETLPEFAGNLRPKRERGGVYRSWPTLQCLSWCRAYPQGRA